MRLVLRGVAASPEQDVVALTLTIEPTSFFSVEPAAPVTKPQDAAQLLGLLKRALEEGSIKVQ